MTSVTLDRAAELLTLFIDADIPAFLWGAPGIGKSDVVKQIADTRGAHIVDIRLSMFDPVDLRGLPTIKGDETIWLRPAIWPKDDTKETILFFDEMDRAAPSVQSAALQIVLNRRIGEHVLPPSTRIVAAGNGTTDRVGTNRTSAAGDNRFAHIYVEPDAEAWRAWAVGAGVHPLVVAFVAFRPNLLHDMTARDARSFPTPRTWETVAKFVDAPDGIRFNATTSIIGEAAASEFEGFVRIFRSLPSLDSIIADPTGSMVPTDHGALYAVACGLSSRATQDNLANILTYVGRLPREFSVLTMVDAHRRDPGLSHTTAFGDWCRANQDITL